MHFKQQRLINPASAKILTQKIIVFKARIPPKTSFGYLLALTAGSPYVRGLAPGCQTVGVDETK